MKIRRAAASDVCAIDALYRRVATTPGGIARLEHEIDDGYVSAFTRRAADDGLQLVGIDPDGAVIAEIHACRPGPFCFSHVLSDLTIVVDPCSQGLGWGRTIFQRFLDMIDDSLPDILRVELVVRESNDKALDFYRSLGFVAEGMLRSRIHNLDGSLEADIPMAWSRES